MSAQRNNHTLIHLRGFPVNEVIIICHWCEYRLPHFEFDYCPHCLGRFSFAKPEVLDLGAYI